MEKGGCGKDLGGYGFEFFNDVLIVGFCGAGHVEFNVFYVGCGGEELVEVVYCLGVFVAED